MKLLLLLPIILFLGCSVKTYPLKGSYPTTPITQISDNSVDKVWDNVIDFFAQNGLAIKIIDKSSGLIISDQTKLSWTHEDKNGNLIKKERWVAIPIVMAPGGDAAMKPVEVRGEWNIRVKAEGNKTLMNVNLVNVEVKYYEYGSQNQYGGFQRADGKSTGVFEKWIFDKIK